MPVTAKLSRVFYEKMGDQVADELVTWFNTVDTTYRNDLRELNEVNFTRFSAQVDRRFAEADAKWEVRAAQVDRRLAEMDAKWEARTAQLDAKIDRVAAQILASVDQRMGEQTRWLFLAWTTLGLAIGGLWFRT